MDMRYNIASHLVHPFTILLLLLLLLLVTFDVRVHAQDHDVAPLYSRGDPVVSLERGNFNSQLCDSNKSWLVLFYLSWCGHCINFVPVYLSVANNLRGWSSYVGVAAINCAQDMNRDICRDHNVTGYPTLMFLPPHTKNTTSAHLIDSENWSSNSTLIKYMIGKVMERHPQAISRAYTPIPSNADKETVANSHDILVTRANSSILFYEDLLFALHYSLDTEVGGQQVISEEALVALNKYLYILSRYFPDGNQDITDGINRLYTAISTLTDPVISHKIWLKHLKDSGLFDSTESQAKLVRCKGSRSKYRGYPCSLWSLFHTLTVQAASSAAKDNELKLQSKNVCYDTLSSIRAYVAHFFTCADCRINFAKMAVDIDSLDGKSEQQCVIWLWSAHNRVNKRLAGESSEDPMHPKTQFPTADLCPFCMTPKGLWNEEVVYDYLHSVYTDLYHLDSPRLHLKTRPLPRRSVQAISVPISSNHTGISRTELSICYFIYFVCGLVIAGLFYFLIVQRRLYLRARRCPKIREGHVTYHKPIY